MADPLWVEALARQYGAVTFTNYLQDRAGPRQSGDGKRALLDAIADVLPLSRVFAWAPDATTATLLAARTIPDSASLSLTTLPEGVPHQFWYFRDPLPAVLPTRDRQPLPGGQSLDNDAISALLIARGVAPTRRPGVDYLMISGFRTATIERSSIKLLAPSDSLVIESGQTIGHWLELAEGAAAIEDQTNRLMMLRMTIAGCLWLKQRIIAPSACHIERHRRKQLARENPHVMLDPQVQLISLRRYEPQAHGANPNPSAVDWHWRWVVSGHWRTLHQPRKADGEATVWVIPHVKGPADRPIKQPATTIYTVTR